MATKPNDDSSLSHTRYFVSTVGLKDEVVREYIRNQELEDMKEAQISKKEYNDPFKGAQK